MYEPIPENYKLMLKNIELNNLNKKIFPFNLAVSNKKETIKMFLSHDTTGHSTVKKEEKYLEVQTTTIKEIFDKNKIERCDLLKIDIEGGEYEILYNLSDAYFKMINKICMEVHDIDDSANNLKNLVPFLESKGFELTVRDDDKTHILFANRT